MRHNVSILLGKEMGKFAPLLAEYIYKYGEGDVAEYHQTKSWVKDDEGNVDIQRAELLEEETEKFVYGAITQLDNFLRNPGIKRVL